MQYYASFSLALTISEDNCFGAEINFASNNLPIRIDYT
jgi:hypothetical protein